MAGLGTLTKHCSLHTRFPLHDAMHVMGWESNQSLTGLLTPSGHSRARLYRRGALLSLRYDHARSMRNALAGNLSPSLTACNTKPRWLCTRWLIGALLLLAFSPGCLSWNWSVGGHSVTDHRSPYRGISSMITLPPDPRVPQRVVHVVICCWRHRLPMTNRIKSYHHICDIHLLR